MNFAEFPLVVLADRPPKGVKTIHYQDEYADPRTGKTIPRKVTIAGSDEHGLPTAKDDEVLVGLLYLTKLANNFAEPTVHFSRRDFLQILKWPEEGKYYNRLAESLYRWLGVTVRYEDCWWDNDKKKYGTEAFHLLDNVSIYDERTRTHQDALGQLLLPLSSFKWNAIPFKSFRHDYIKGLDLELFLQLPGAAAKRAFRFLDKALPAAHPLAFDLHLFACEKVGMSRNYKPARLITEVQATVVNPLEAAEFLAPMDPKDRFVKHGRGRYNVVFARKPPAALLPPAGPPGGQPAAPADSTLLAELRRLRVSGRKSRELLATYPPDYIEAKIDIVDWLLQNKNTRELRNPAGFLLKALEDDYQPPEGYQNKQQREEVARRLQEHQEKQRQKQEAEQRKQADEAAARQARRDHIDGYLRRLAPAEREALEQQAFAKAGGFERDLLRKEGPLAEAIRQGLIDKEVLLVHPLPTRNP